MDMYDSLFSPGAVLSEQIARQVFDLLPEPGPVMAIIDRQGNCWPSDSERFAEIAISEAFLKELCSRIDDGHEPIVTQANDFSIIASQLATDRTNCGYVVMVLPQNSPEATLANTDLIEIILNQIGLVARLIEKNNSVFEQPFHRADALNTGGVSLN